ncbi:MAG: Asparagine synthetase [glutamine-hydrolyzing] (EC [uncultured Sulfurovum sp.]|uniref:asparagine synthase (glutamine-hydrolyzing) n=1 Tax=uncultured Sulfurovum sp. TaxID=269237 RepID=A0A6S6T859_9BACT|nr:MAG: Asparagine synthetase [glutamine-hydrolyzing] (EC [uncultured Sulfurovum sp.]
MCGIVGFNGQNSDVLENMLESIEHRGPDDKGVYEESGISLGHARLSILDLSSLGHQPMIFEHLRMVYNGEIYNFKEIRQELVELDYTFISDTDSEVILKAYHAWGIKAVDKFIGMFAIAIYDINSLDLVLIRDRVGVKPLYYFFDGEVFVFASELKPIMAYRHNLEISKDALHEFFQFGYISSNLSIFEKCYKVPAGNYLTFNLKQMTLDISEYWSILPFFERPKFKKTEEELVNELEALLIDAFKYRMISDVPVGVFLSGGIDSSIVAAILQKHHGNIHTFTIGFEESKYNEATFAKEVAKHLGTTHSEKFLGVKEAKEILKSFVDIYDEPFGDSSAIPTTLVSKMAKEAGIKVVLSADGGDEIFCGYERYWVMNRVGKKIHKIPKVMRKVLGFLMNIPSQKVVTFLIRNALLQHRFLQFREVLANDSWKNMYEAIVHTSKNYELSSLLNHKHQIEEKAFEIGQKDTPMQGMMLWDYHRYMVDDILTKVDRATMSVSIEGREPLLDHRIAEFMAQVPFEFKYKNGDSKYLLRKVLERYIPQEMINRPKKGFAIPMFEWFANDLSSLFEEHLKKEALEEHNLFDYKYVQQEHQKLKKNKALNVNKLWYVLVFQLWYKQYISKRSKHVS